jgi:hypothetical protein
MAVSEQEQIPVSREKGLVYVQSTIVSVPSSEYAPSTSFPQASACVPPLDPGGDTLACGKGVGGANSDDRPGDSGTLCP